jgi:hypothetical protein
MSSSKSDGTKSNLHAQDFDYFIVSSKQRGYRYREIAEFIGYSPAAVGVRIMKIKKKYGVKDLSELWREQTIEKGDATAKE